MDVVVNKEMGDEGSADLVQDNGLQKQSFEGNVEKEKHKNIEKTQQKDIKTYLKLLDETAENSTVLLNGESVVEGKNEQQPENSPGNILNKSIETEKTTSDTEQTKTVNVILEKSEVIQKTNQEEKPASIKEDGLKETERKEDSTSIKKEVVIETKKEDISPSIKKEVLKEAKTDEISPSIKKEVQKETKKDEFSPSIKKEVSKETKEEETSPSIKKEVLKETKKDEISPSIKKEVLKETKKEEILTSIKKEPPKDTDKLKGSTPTSKLILADTEKKTLEDIVSKSNELLNKNVSSNLQEEKVEIVTRDTKNSKESANGNDEGKLEGIRKSLILKTKGNIFYKKKGPFSSWKTLYMIVDENKQQMNFFKSKEVYENLASCKISVDIKFINQIKPYKIRIIQSKKFPFKLYRRAGLSTVKLAAETEEERAKWITTIEEILEALKSSQEKEMLGPKKSFSLPNHNQKEKGDDASSNSETCTASSAPENEDLIRPKKVLSSGFKIDANQIVGVKLKRASSENKKYKESNKENEDGEKRDSDQKFGVSLRRVKTERIQTRNFEKEKSPEYVEFKQKYNSLSLSRKSKNANLPLNENSVCSHIVENHAEDNLTVNHKSLKPTASAPSTLAKQQKSESASSVKETPRKRSPSPNIPMSKNVETFIKHNEEPTKNIMIHHAIEEVENFKLSQIDIPMQNENIKLNIVDLKHKAPENISENTATINIPTISINRNIENIQETDATEKEINLIEKPSPIKTEDTFTSTDETKVSLTSDIETKEEVEDESKSDSLKINTIKKFIVKMNSDADENNEEYSKTIETSTKTNIEKTTEDSSELKSNEECEIRNVRISSFGVKVLSKDDYRSSGHSFLSQVSTESDEPIPRLNFMGKPDRSSSGSTIIKDNSDIDEPGDGSINAPYIREQKKNYKRPDSFSGRSSLVLPEFTVVEEKLEEMQEATLSKKESDLVVKSLEPTTLVEEQTNIDVEITELDLIKQIPTAIIHQALTKDQDPNVVKNLVDQESNSVIEGEVSLKCTENEIAKSTAKHFVNKLEMKLSHPITEVPSITKEKYISEVQSINTTKEDDIAKSLEIIDDDEEAADYFPIIGDSQDVAMRSKSENITSHCLQQDVRTSGIIGLKEFIKDNSSPHDSSAIISGINRLGASPAIEKLRSEIPK